MSKTICKTKNTKVVQRKDNKTSTFSKVKVNGKTKWKKTGG